MKMHRKSLAESLKGLILWILPLFILGSCDVINPEEQVPAYVYVDEMSFQAGAGQGSSSSRITEVWFYAGGEFLGAYDMPATIPVVQAGDSEIRLFPGVKINGIINTPDIYPFYKTIDVNLNLQPLKTDTIRPQTSYKDNVRFAMVEDFEQNHIFVEDEDGNPATSMQSSKVDVFEGEFSGRIHLVSGDNDFCEAATLVKFAQIPTNGTPVYLEMNYKNTMQFTVGLIGHQSNIAPAKNYIIAIRPRDFWNKIYIDLTEVLNLSDLESYQVVIAAALEDGQSEGTVFLDNVKMLHFN